MTRSILTRKSVIIAGVALFALLAVLLSVALYPSDHVVQPLAYNHKVHTENAGLGCADCHANAEQMASATIPSLQVCQNCHSGEPISQSPVERELLKYIADKKEIPWKAIYKVPDHVYFSHRRHVVGGKLDCSVCHGNVGEFTKPVSFEEIRVTMENCMSCHQQQNVSNDCLACHR
ncbi:MAG: cytochrome c3 family protein [Bacteroidota bacterium]